MTEKTFLAGYSGQTLEELLALASTHRVDSIVLAVEEALQKKAPTDLEPPERVVLAVEALEREVNNGGYNQFFLNEPAFAHDITDALDEIGCAETARITREAAAVLGIQPDWTIDQIQAAAADSTDEVDARLSELDDEFFTYPDQIDDRLLAFIRTNVNDIRL